MSEGTGESHKSLKGLAIKCNENGEILKVIRDDFDTIQQDKSLNELLDKGSKNKWTNFKNTLIEELAAYNWQLNVCYPSNNGVLQLYFSGVISGEELLIIGVESKKDSDMFYQEVMKMADENTVQLRAALKKISSSTDISEITGEADYAGFTELNNELISLQRELIKKNRKIEELYNKLDEELNKARKIHERTLPTNFPELDNLEIAAYYQPARKIGGDFYNVIKKDNKVIFYLSDVTGHGLEGAIVSAFVKEAIDSYIKLKPNDISPENLMRHLHEQYKRDDYPGDYFISFFLGILDLETCELSFTGAGFQESMLVYLDKEKKCSFISEGPPISNVIPLELMDFRPDKITLEPGSTIMINTDGLTEQLVNEKTFYERKEKVFYENAHLSPEHIKAAINEEFKSFNDGLVQGKDDITYLIIQISPSKGEICNGLY